ncbi:MAG TPA: class I SAM-dependent methyltransferase [Gaiellaceae bacterium]
MRPPYFAPVLDRAQESLALAEDSRVLDLAAGTGRLTRELVQRFGSVTAVEPDDQMRDLIDVGTALAGSAEAIPLQDATIDCVFVGDAFHWFDAMRAIGEIARVLVRGGGLVIVWTHWWEPEPPLPADAVELLSEPYDRFAAQRPEPWDDSFDDSPFEPLRREEFAEELTVDSDLLLAMYSTTSSFAVLPDADRTALFERVRPLLSGTYRLPIKHQLTWTRLRDG